MFNGARAAIGQARIHLQEGRVAERGAAISKAIKIVDEGLKTGLNMEAGGDVAANLSRLYDYIVRTLLTANLKSDAEQLDIADRLLADLAELGRHPSTSRQAACRRDGPQNEPSQPAPARDFATSLTHLSLPILEHYQEIAVITGEMLTAQAGDWDTAMVHGQQYCELVERLRTTNRPCRWTTPVAR